MLFLQKKRMENEGVSDDAPAQAERHSSDQQN
jgi:hypothetical protein